MRYKVEIQGDFYSHDLYDENGFSIFGKHLAAETAERIYGTSWLSVFNGQDSMEREEWALRKDYGRLIQRVNELTQEALEDSMSVSDAAGYVADSLLDEFCDEIGGS